MFYGHTIRSNPIKTKKNTWINTSCGCRYTVAIFSITQYSIHWFARSLSLSLRAWDSKTRLFDICIGSVHIGSWRAFISLSLFWCGTCFTLFLWYRNTTSTCRNRSERIHKNTDTQQYLTADCRKTRGPNRWEKKRIECVTRYTYASKMPHRQFSLATKWFHRMWVTTVCFVPLFFSTSTDFELNGTTQPCGSVE